MSAKDIRTETIKSRLIAFLLSLTDVPSEKEWTEHARKLRSEGLYSENMALPEIVNVQKNMMANLLRDVYRRPTTKG